MTVQEYIGQQIAESGIYVFTRCTEYGLKFAYVGQSVNMCNRIIQHLQGYEQYIDLSIRKHGLYSQDNVEGWQLELFPCDVSCLNEEERKYILQFANAGYQLRNKTLGGQDKGKTGILSNNPSKGYRDGLKQGYKNAQKFVKQLFDKNLIYSVNGKQTKNKTKAFGKFTEFIS